MQYAKTTNVKASDLNYDRYTSSAYDRDIVNSIPFHKALHQHLISYVTKKFAKKEKVEMIDLGVGTGITSKLIQDSVKNLHIDAVDFSQQMLAGAKKRLGNKNVKYIFGDYGKLTFDKKYDLVVSVIGIHHQNTAGKKAIFKKIYAMLKKGGVFILGDLVTYKDKMESAKNHALHYHQLVEKSATEKALAEWAHHHMFLNDLSPIEDQISRLKSLGFKVKKEFLKINTALLICEK